IKIEKNTKYSFVSKNKKIAKVSKKGIITGLKKGKCRVVVNTKSKKTIYTVTVKKNKNSPVNPTHTPEPVYTPNPTQSPDSGPKVGGERIIAQGIISEIQPLETGKCRYKIECNMISFVSVSDKVKYAYVTVNWDRDYYKAGNEVMLFSFSDVDYTVVDESTISFNVDFMHLVN
ncbi:MAG: hypothetical protein K2K09_01850, partial [Lachnospiraceae bacterium]|nr:hypothetical protein [Lachnospiraceae bacterium]